MRWIIVLGVISIVGIIITQLYWIGQAYSLKEDNFSNLADAALNSVAQKLVPIGMTTEIIDPVQQVQSNYYIVEIDYYPELVAVEYLLKTEFETLQLTTDFEYGFYDCGIDSLQYGKYVHFDSTFVAREHNGSLPEFEFDKNYFGVLFPLKENYLFRQMGFWVFSSIILVLVIVFLGYAIFVLLKQRRLSEIRRDFINNMTHEFKTPISTIAISSEVLLKPETSEPKRIRKYARIIAKENLRMQHQVEKVLQMATLDKSDLKLNRESLHVHAIIDDAIHSIEAALEEKGGRVVLDKHAKHDQINADKVHLSNVIYNLLDNAVKYSSKEPYIEIKTNNEKRGISVSIKDNGIGIPKEAQKNIFTKFYRVPTGNVHNVKGFGLGLSYVKLMIEAHKGTISLNSEPGVGTTFEIWLPQS